MKKNNVGFTLIELIISMAILSIVIMVIFSIFSFGNSTFAIGTDNSNNQFNARFSAGQISSKVRNATTVVALDNSEISSLIASDTFDTTKQYIYVKEDIVTGDKAIIHRVSTVEHTLLGGLEGNVELLFGSPASNNMLTYSVKSSVNGKEFFIASKVLLHNMKSGSITNTASGNPGVAICYGPIVSSDAVQLDKSTVSAPVFANAVTTDLVLPLVGPNGSNIAWTATWPIEIPVVTALDVNLGFITATVNPINKPAEGIILYPILTAVFSKGTHSTTATYTVPIVAYDTLMISAPGTITPGTKDVSYNYAFIANGGSGIYSFSPGSALPTGLNLSSTGVLSGIPTTLGTTTINIIVSDGIKTVNKSVGISIYNALNFTTISLPDAQKGILYTFDRFLATGGSGAISFTSNNLPTWLNLNSNGILNGIPPINADYSITVKAMDDEGRSAEKSFNIKVKNN